MSTTTTTVLDGVVEDAAAHLYVWALKDIPQDLRDALAAARDRETSKTGIDPHGNSLYHDVQALAHDKLKELYARL